MFPVCFFWYFLLFGSVDIQHFTIRKQILKKKIMMVIGACIFFIAAAQALPLFFGMTNNTEINLSTSYVPLEQVIDTLPLAA